jgi:hypothetical protein
MKLLDWLIHWLGYDRNPHRRALYRNSATGEYRCFPGCERCAALYRAERKERS